MVTHRVLEKASGVQRVGCIFGAPVYLQFDAVELTVVVRIVSPVLVFFDVLIAEGKSAIRNGFCVSAGAATARL